MGTTINWSPTLALKGVMVETNYFGDLFAVEWQREMLIFEYFRNLSSFVKAGSVAGIIGMIEIGMIIG